MTLSGTCTMTPPIMTHTERGLDSSKSVKTKIANSRNNTVHYMTLNVSTCSVFVILF